jgi:hypothetical protein
MKQVVFIAGTAYSGSSMLDMMIGNSNSSFSIGEVYALFNPLEQNHINPPCGCGNDKCNIWSSLRKAGKENLYVNIFNQFAFIQTIIDSSKDVFWINQQQRNLNGKGIASKVILIWKSPEEFAMSRFKRGSFKGWDHAWLNYHKLFFSLISNWRSIKYSELAMQPELKLKQLCSHLSIPYKEKMENFWEKKHHMLFGNTLAKYHTYDKGETLYIEAVDKLKLVERKYDHEISNLLIKHRTISYSGVLKDKLPESVLTIANSNTFSDIVAALASRDIGDNSYVGRGKPDFNKLEFSKLLVELFRAKSIVKQRIFYIRNKNKLCYDSK